MTIRFKVKEIKVICDVIDDAGNPTCEVTDLSGVLFDSVKIGMCGYAQDIPAVAKDSCNPLLVATSVVITE